MQRTEPSDHFTPLNINNDLYATYATTGNSLILLSEIDGTALAALGFKASSRRGARIALETNTLIAPYPDKATENVQRFQGLVNIPGQEFELVLTNLSPDLSINFDLIKMSSSNPEMETNYCNLNEVNDIHAYESYAVQCDRSNGLPMILEKYQDPMTNSARTVEVDELEQTVSGKESKGTNLFLSVAPQKQDPNTLNRFSKTVWKVADVIVVRRPVSATVATGLTGLTGPTPSTPAVPLIQDFYRGFHDTPGYESERISIVTHNLYARPENLFMPLEPLHPAPNGLEQSWFSESPVSPGASVDPSRIIATNSVGSFMPQIRDIRDQYDNDVTGIFTGDTDQYRPVNINWNDLPDPTKRQFMDSRDNTGPVTTMAPPSTTIAPPSTTIAPPSTTMAPPPPEPEAWNWASDGKTECLAPVQEPQHTGTNVTQDINIIRQSEVGRIVYGKEKIDEQYVETQTEFDYTKTSKPCVLGLSISEQLEFTVLDPMTRTRALMEEAKELLAGITAKNFDHFLRGQIYGSQECAVCLETGLDCVLYRCAHKCGHYNCVQSLQKCPVCRAYISAKIKMPVS
jgi:hypothetical protein